MEYPVKVVDSETLLRDITNLKGKDFYIETTLNSCPSVLQMMSMVKRWRMVSDRLHRPIKVIAYCDNVEIDKAFQRLILNDKITFCMLKKGAVLID